MFVVHEKTLIHALDMLKLWCDKFTWTIVPLTLVSCFKVRIVLDEFIV